MVCSASTRPTCKPSPATTAAKASRPSTKSDPPNSRADEAHHSWKRLNQTESSHWLPATKWTQFEKVCVCRGLTRHGQVSQNLANHRSEFEAVPRKPRRKDDVRQPGMTVHNEVLVGRVGIQAYPAKRHRPSEIRHAPYKKF